MKKCFLLLFCLATCQTLLFSQRSSRAMRHEIDSLLHVLPSLKDIKKVDCLIRLANIYDGVFADKKSWDSSYAYALQAYDLSKRLGYKKGLAQSYIQMASEKTLEIDQYIYNTKKIDDAVLKRMIDSCEYYNKQAFLIGEKLNNNGILGSSYWNLSGLVYSRNGYDLKDEKEKDLVEGYLKKAAMYFEKTSDQISLGCVYRDLFYIYQEKNNSKLTEEYADRALSVFLKAGDDRMLGDFYFFNLGRFHQDKNDITAQENDLKRAIYYYEKAGETQKLSSVYSSLSGLYQGRFKFKEAEELMKNAISFFKKTGNEEGENSVSISLSSYYMLRGDFEKGLPVCERSIQLTEKLSSGSTSKRVIWGTPYFYMSRFYKYGGDYETALSYIYKCKTWYVTDSSALGNWTAEVGDIYRIIGNYDSAMHYLKIFATDTRLNFSGFGKSILASLYIDLKEYDKAIPLIIESMKAVEKISKSQNGYNYTALARVYFEKKNYDDALKNARMGQILLKNQIHKMRIIENLELMSHIFYNLKKYDSAYYYLKEYTSMKDSLLTRQFYWRLNNYKKFAEEEKRIGQINLLHKDNLLKHEQLKQESLLKEQREAELSLLDKDNRIKQQQLNQEIYLRKQKEADVALLNKGNQLKEQKLKQQAFLRNGLIMALITLFLLSVFVFRTLVLKRRNEKLKNEKIQAELRQKAIELEMQALRAQMNPHFIFNCLSSINRFIIKNETEAASDYLTRFSRLIRMVLVNSQKPLITLEDELEMLKLYLDMERLRFKNSFDYNIQFKNRIDAGAVFIPPLLLQPFCENAIWHGLMHKEGQGSLHININMQDNVLNCTITDNGIGREKAAELKSKSAEKDKSLGLKITKERLTLINRNNGTQTLYKIEDLYNEAGTPSGTEVKLQIRYKESVEETV